MSGLFQNFIPLFTVYLVAKRNWFLELVSEGGVIPEKNRYKGMFVIIYYLQKRFFSERYTLFEEFP
jgi:hypothetical protein